MFVSGNVNHVKARELSMMSSFGLIKDLRKYLGCLCYIPGNTKSSTNTCLKKPSIGLAHGRSSLSFARRVILAQFVLVALPTYVMQSILLPLNV